jgi:hypothetical protein
MQHSNSSQVVVLPKVMGALARQQRELVSKPPSGTSINSGIIYIQSEDILDI